MEVTMKPRLMLTLIPVAACSLSIACTPVPKKVNFSTYESRAIKRAETVEKAVEKLPEWFSTPKADADDAVYSVGTAIGPNLQLSYDRAILNAKLVLADRVDGLMSAKVRSFIAESGQDEDKVFTAEAERVVTNFMAEVNVSGYAMEHTEIQSSWGRYRVYVMLKYPVGKANDVLMMKLNRSLNRDSKKRRRDAFRELDEDVRRHRERIIEENI
jgi:hypothetical protein